MIVERDGFVYIPVRAFARIAGVEPFMITQYIATGVIHHTYVIHVDSYDGGNGGYWLERIRQERSKTFWKLGNQALRC